MTETHVVTCFLRSGTDILLLLRSGKVASYAGKWGAVAGHVDGDPEQTAYNEIREESGFENPRFVHRGHNFEVRDQSLDKHWVVHPFLFDVPRQAPDLNWESSTYEWVSPVEILRRDVVPELWTSYRHVAPTVESIRRDTIHGSAYLSLRAVEVLRDRAAELASEVVPGDRGVSVGWKELCTLAESLLAAQPAMAAVRNRVNRVMHEAAKSRTVASVESAASDALRRAVTADDDAGAAAARLIADKRVLTLSRSGTVIEALKRARPELIVALSLPGGEGRGVAEQLAAVGLPVAMCSDAGIPAACDQADAVLVGADTILADGSVVNKVGTRMAALCARDRSIPMYVASAADKISADCELDLEQAGSETLYDGDAAIRLINPLFERTSPDLVTGIVTERGILDPPLVRRLAEELGRLASWH